MLGLGDLEIAGREHRQPIGGRIDFLMRDAEQETYYEIEVMLGAPDESHIIRTIEYWDKRGCTGHAFRTGITGTAAKRTAAASEK